MSLILPRYQALTKNIKAIIAWMPQKTFLFPMESKRVESIYTKLIVLMSYMIRSMI